MGLKAALAKWFSVYLLAFFILGLSGLLHSDELILRFASRTSDISMDKDNLTTFEVFLSVVEQQSECTGFSVEAKPMPIMRQFREIDQGKLDAMYIFSSTLRPDSPYADRGLVISKEPVFSMATYLVALEGSGIGPVESIEQIYDKRIGHNLVLARELEVLLPDYENAVLMKDAEAIATAMTRERIHLALTLSFAFDRAFKNLPDNVTGGRDMEYIYELPPVGMRLGFSSKTLGDRAQEYADRFDECLLAYKRKGELRALLGEKGLTRHFRDFE